MELEAVNGVIPVFYGHDLTVLCAGRDSEAFRHGGFHGGQGVVPCGPDGLRHVMEEGALCVQCHVVGFAVDQFLGVGYGGAEAFAI